jgi:hypothetical protein
MSQFDPGTARFLTQGLQAGLGLGMDAQQIEMQRARQRMFEQQAAEEAQMRLRQREANKRLTGALFQKRGQTPTMAGGQLAAAVTAPQPQFPGAASMGQDAFSAMMRGGAPALPQQGQQAGGMPQVDPLDLISPDDVADADPNYQRLYFNAKQDRQQQQEEYDQASKLFGYMNRTGMMRAASPAMVEKFMKFGMSIPDEQQPLWLKEKMQDEKKQRAADMIVMLRRMGRVKDDSQPSVLGVGGGDPSGMQVPGAGMNRRQFALSELQGQSPELLEMIFDQAKREEETALLVEEARRFGVDPQLYVKLTPAQRGQFALGRMDPKSGNGASQLTPAAEVAFYRQRFEDVAGKDTSPPTPYERKIALLDPDNASDWKIVPGVSRPAILAARAKVETFDAWIAAQQRFSRGNGQPQPQPAGQMMGPMGQANQDMPFGGGGMDYAPASGAYPVASEEAFLESLDDEFVRRYGVEPDPSNPDHRAKSQALYAETQRAPTGSRQ